jgi:uncharacterized protein YjiS (DUF1127 family)
MPQRRNEYPGFVMSRTLDLPHSGSRPARFASPAWRKLSDIMSRMLRNALNEWMARRAVETLSGLDDRTLNDIGIRRSEIETRVRQHLPPQ